MRRFLILTLPLLAACVADPASRLDVTTALNAPQVETGALAEADLEVLDIRRSGVDMWSIAVRATHPGARAPRILGAWSQGRPWSFSALDDTQSGCGSGQSCKRSETVTVSISRDAFARASGSGGLDLLLSGDDANFRAIIPADALLREIAR